MCRIIEAVTIAMVISASAIAQSPSPSPSPSATPAATVSPAKSTTPSPSPTVSPTSRELIDSLGQNDLQAAITVLKNNFTNPAALNEPELSRATLQGLLDRLPHGVMLLPGRETAAAGPPAHCYGEIFEGHVGYLRPGSLNSANLKESDKKLEEFTSKKVDAVIIDLRASASGDFSTAADLAARFCPKGKLLFTLRKPAARQDRSFNSDRDPSFQGLMTVLADGETAGAAEPVAAALRFYDKALIIGETTAGQAVEYSDLPLPSGKILRVAVTEAVSPDGQMLFPGGINSDLPVEMSMVEKRQIFQASSDKGMSSFVYEAERPHLNEAALIAGTNPELDAVEAVRRNRGRDRLPARDPVLQRALDLVTSLKIYQKR